MKRFNFSMPAVLPTLAVGVSSGGLRRLQLSTMLGLLLASPSLFGQGNPAPSQSGANPASRDNPAATTPPGRANTALADEIARRPDLVRTEKQAFDEAKVQVKGGNMTRAVDSLSASNLAKRDTPEWHLENHGKLVLLADRLSREGQLRDTTATVTEALRQLDAADDAAKKADDPRSRARAKAAQASLHERYRGDPAAALASYQAALALNPQDEGTKEAYERLRRSYENLQARTKAGKK